MVARHFDADRVSEVSAMAVDMIGLKDWRFAIDPQGIAWATFDREGESQNSLSRRALEELGAIVERVEQGARDKTIRGLVIMSGKEKGFIVGADNIVVFRPVKVGIAGEQYFEILSGLMEREKIVAGTSQALRDLKVGALVKQRKDAKKDAK